MSDLVNAAFLPCDLFDSFTKETDMVKTKCGHSGHHRFRYNVGAIVCSPNPYFQNCGIYLKLC